MQNCIHFWLFIIYIYQVHFQIHISFPSERQRGKQSVKNKREEERKEKHARLDSIKIFKIMKWQKWKHSLQKIHGLMTSVLQDQTSICTNSFLRTETIPMFHFQTVVSPKPLKEENHLLFCHLGGSLVLSVEVNIWCIPFFFLSQLFNLKSAYYFPRFCVFLFSKIVSEK